MKNSYIHYLELNYAFQVQKLLLTSDVSSSGRTISSVTVNQPLHFLWRCFYSHSQNEMFFQVPGHKRDLENKYLHRGWWLMPPLSDPDGFKNQASLLVRIFIDDFCPLPINGMVVLCHIICDCCLMNFINRVLVWLPVWTSCLTFVLLPSCVRLVWFHKHRRSHPRRISYNSCMVFHIHIHKFVIGLFCPLGVQDHFIYKVLTGFISVWMIYLL